MADITIRPYQPSDRQAVRTIACDTADKGEPVENFFSDRELFADLITRYYTDFEPQSSWAAEQHGEVVGYLTGCKDSRRYGRVMNWRIIPEAIIKAILRGVLFHRDTWRLLGVGIKIWRIRGSRQYISLEEYPAHLHVNVQKEYRGGKIGQHLLEKFLDQMKAAQAKGVHLCTRADNLRGQHFFQKMGFTELTRYPTVRLSRGREDISYNIIYGKRIT